MFELVCDGVKDNILQDKYGNKSRDLIDGIPQISFPLSWKGIPENTKSFTITFLDFDNIEDEGVMWIHWLVADINENICELKEDASRENGEIIQGINSWVLPYGPYENICESLLCRYGGPAPDREHEYEINIYALDKVLGLKEGFTYNKLRKNMEGHILDRAKLKFKYGANECK